MALVEAGINAAPMPIIDTHIHLFDTGRAAGVPWPPKDDPILYKPALPDRYRKIATPLGIVGAIEVEASPWIEDNQWVLDLAARDKIIVGTVGNLEPGDANFAAQLERFHRNPLFLGIRYGNLWNRDIGAELSKPAFREGLKLLAQAGLVLDTANPDPALIANMLRVTDLVPNLRVVMDHLPQLEPPSDAPAHETYIASLRELAKRPQVFVKISEVLRRANGRVPDDLSFYKPRLDELFGIFGEDRLFYGSDWPNSDQWGPYPLVLSLVKEYFAQKGSIVAQKYFWKNSKTAYRWVKREPAQP